MAQKKWTEEIGWERIIGYIYCNLKQGKTVEELTVKNGWSDDFAKKLRNAMEKNDLTLIRFLSIQI